MGGDLRSAYYTPLRYPGGKGKLAPYVKRILEANNLVDGVYVEPYAGGAGVAMELLLQEYVKQVWINDVSPGVGAFWRSVLKHTDALCDAIEKADLSMPEWYRQREIQKCPDDYDDLEVGYSFFFLNRTNRSGILHGGVIGGKDQTGPWKLDARFNTSDLVQRIRAIARLKRRVEFQQMDALEFIDELVPSLPARSLIYLDPPYYVKGSNLYPHFYEHADHVTIAKRVGRLGKQHWIVSYDNAPEIQLLYRRFRGIVYGLSYSAQDRYKGAEAMFFSNKLVVPDVVAPMHRAA